MSSTHFTAGTSGAGARRGPGRRFAFLLAVLVSAMALAACSTTTTETPPVGPRAWIDFPREGVTIPLGASVVVVSHADAADGISEVLLSVNGSALRRDTSSTPGDTLVEFRQEWVPSTPGLITLEVRAYTADDGASGADTITVVVEGGPSQSPTPETTTPAPEPTAPEASPTTSPPAPAPTTPRPTAGPPTTSPAPPPTTPPPTTPSPTNPPPTTPPADVTPPPVPVPAVPADGLAISCRSSQTLAWLPVTDPSGVTYAVKLEQQITATTWESVRVAGMIAAKQYDVPVQCGGLYRWTVRARDNAGNTSAWSAYSYFSVDMG